MNPEDLDSSLTSAGLWSVFKDWFYFLLRHNFFWEAHRISQSLFYALPQLESQELVQDYIKQALRGNTDQDLVKIAVSSTVQHFVYAFKSPHPSVLAVVQWNDAITWALFGVILGKADEDSASLFNRLCLRRSLELELNMSLPLNGENEDDGSSNLPYEAARYGDTALMDILTKLPGTCTLYELNRRAFSSAALLYSQNMLPFLRSEIVNAQDGYQRTPLHWASLMAQGNAVETLLGVGQADTGLLDWFGCIPLHYAISSRVPGSEVERLRIVKALLKSDHTSVNKRNSTGQTPLNMVLNMAIDEQSYDVARILLESGATIEVRDYGALLLIGGQNIEWLSSWKRLLSKHDRSQPPTLSDRREFEAPARISKRASLHHPGTIDLDTYAALCLRGLRPDYTEDFLPLLRALLECEFSAYDLPASSQVQDIIREGQRSAPKPRIAADRYHILLESILPGSTLQDSN